MSGECRNCKWLTEAKAVLGGYVSLDLLTDVKTLENIKSRVHEYIYQYSSLHIEYDERRDEFEAVIEALLASRDLVFELDKYVSAINVAVSDQEIPTEPEHLS